MVATGKKGHGPPRAPVIVILVVVPLVVIAWYVWSTLSNREDPTRLDVSGRLEGYETNLSPKIGGRVDVITVREGAVVNAGQLVASMSDEDYQAQLRAAEARIARAKDAVRQKQDQLAVVRAQIGGAQKRLAQAGEETGAQIAQSRAALHEAEARAAQAKADLQQAKADLDLATVRLTRYTNLVKKGAVTKDEYDQARNNYNNSMAQVASKQSNVRAAAASVEAARAEMRQSRATRFTPPIRRSDVTVFQAQLNQAQHDVAAAQKDVTVATAERDQIKANINYLKIVSPIHGVVTARPVEPGAVLTPGQTVLTILDLSQVYMRGYVPEKRIGNIKVGQPANIYLDSAPDKALAGKIIEIDPVASFTPENIYFKDDRVKQVFGIKIGINEPGGYAKPGMPADARIDL